MRRLSLMLAAAALALALLPATALAHDGGQGWYGTVDDKVTTNAGFIVIGFFPLLVFLLSMLQWRLDKRKDARKAAAKARAARHEWRGGW